MSISYLMFTTAYIQAITFPVHTYVMFNNEIARSLNRGELVTSVLLCGRMKMENITPKAHFQNQ